MNQGGTMHKLALWLDTDITVSRFVFGIAVFVGFCIGGLMGSCS